MLSDASIRIFDDLTTAKPACKSLLAPHLGRFNAVFRRSAPDHGCKPVAETLMLSCRFGLLLARFAHGGGHGFGWIVIN